jgi:hypothetical protein
MSVVLKESKAEDLQLYLEGIQSQVENLLQEYLFLDKKELILSFFFDKITRICEPNNRFLVG